MPRTLRTALLLLCTCVFTWSASAQTEKPNIIWIVSDDCGYADFSMHGSDTPTPRIDSIANDGVRFTNAYATACVCSPARAALLTGRYQQRFGHEFNVPGGRDESHGLPLTETLISDVLHDAGYRTIAIGKWHLGSADHFLPTARGFTDFYGFLQGGRGYFPVTTGRRAGTLLRDTEPIADENFDYLTDHLADEAVRYIEDSTDGPFFMYLAFNGTHSPFHTTDADLAAADGDAIAAMTIALDRAVGKVLDALDAHGLAEDTLVVFANDHGGTRSHDNGPLNGSKGTLWEGGLRVPFVMRWPGVIDAGRVVEEPIITLDLFPTALAAAGIDESPGEPLDGINLLPHLADGGDAIAQRTLYWKLGDRWAVRNGDLKLCVPGGRRGGTTMQLFDLANDLGEQRDLADDRPEDVARLLALYEAWAATHAPPAWEEQERSAGDAQREGREGRGGRGDRGEQGGRGSQRERGNRRRGGRE
ncbi:MAG: sulfatase-like hydrolase/transferase [Planctomycetota bacterium]